METIVLIGVIFLIIAGTMLYLEGFDNLNNNKKAIGIATLILSAIASLSALIYFATTPHEDNCKCQYCYEEIGMINGVEIFDHENKLHYYDKPNKQYVEIIQEDGTPYTYQEFIENQLKEVEK